MAKNEGRVIACPACKQKIRLPGGTETVPTGVWGFCVRCGDVVEVLVTADDRLQNRLVRAAAAIATNEGWPSLEALARLRMQLGEAHVASSVGKSLANYGLIDGDPLRASRSAAIELRRRMQEEMVALVIAEASLAQWLGEPVDLLREATEDLERRVEQTEEVGDGGR